MANMKKKREEAQQIQNIALAALMETLADLVIEDSQKDEDKEGD